ncbi:MAG: hypothetical protein H0Z39_04945 [Peptococcaceae bacterium]|nr:hypothetical protein [Peptococcaceae bacterium]
MSQELKEWSIAGQKLQCPVCGHREFWHRTTLMNTRLATFVGFDWANQEADNFVCGRCGYVLWFMEPPIDREQPEKVSDPNDVHPQVRAEIRAHVAKKYKLALGDIEVKGTPFEDKYLANTPGGVLVIELGGFSPVIREWNEDEEVRAWLKKD